MLETLRAKPSHVKQIVSLSITLVIFSAILFVWVSSRDARSRELEVRDKTISPISGVTSMFDGFISGFKEKISTGPAIIKTSDTKAVATTTDTFDLSGVVVIDPMGSTTKAK